MNSNLLRAISADQVATYHRDGVVLLPGMFDGEWVDPDHSAFMTEHGLRPGDRPGTDLYPQVWARSLI